MFTFPQACPVAWLCCCWGGHVTRTLAAMCLLFSSQAKDLRTALGFSVLCWHPHLGVWARTSSAGWQPPHVWAGDRRFLIRSVSVFWGSRGLTVRISRFSSGYLHMTCICSMKSTVLKLILIKIHCPLFFISWTYPCFQCNSRRLNASFKGPSIAQTFPGQSWELKMTALWSQALFV